MKKIPYVVRIEREDGQKMSCIVALPIDFNEVAEGLNTPKQDDYDELIENEVMDKIYFEGLGFDYIEIIKYDESFKGWWNGKNIKNGGLK